MFLKLQTSAKNGIPIYQLQRYKVAKVNKLTGIWRNELFQKLKVSIDANFRYRKPYCSIARWMGQKILFGIHLILVARARGRADGYQLVKLFNWREKDRSLYK